MVLEADRAAVRGFALGAGARATAVMAMKVLAMVLRFMTISFLIDQVTAAIRSPGTSKKTSRLSRAGTHLSVQAPAR